MSAAETPWRSVTRTSVRRLLLLLATLPITWIATSPGAGALDDDYRTRSQLGGRLSNLLRQEAAIAQGHYLADAKGGSFTREATEVVGLNLWFADLALARQLLGRPPPNRSDALSLQPWLCSLGLVAVILGGAPTWVVAWMVLLFTLFPAPVTTPEGQRAWPQLLALAVCIALVLRIAGRGRAGGLGKATLLALFGWGVVAGLAGFVRDEAGVSVSFVLLAIAGLHGAAWIFGRGRPEHSGGPELRIALATGLALVGVAAASLGVSANLWLFERLEGVEHQPVLGRHLFWHPLFVGLGQEFRAQENLSGADGAAISAMHAETGAFRGYAAPNYDRALRDRWLQLAYDNTPLVLQIYVHKLRRLILDPERPRVSALFVLFLAALGAGLIKAVREPPQSPEDTVLLTAAAALPLIHLAPGLMMNPSYADNLEPALLSGGLLAVMVATRRSDSEASDGAYAARIRIVLVLVAAMLGLSIAVVAGRAVWVIERRSDLSEALLDGTLTLDAALDAYHADVTLAFNGLPEEQRRALLRSLMAGSGPSRSRPVGTARRSADSPLRAVVWRGDSLFAFLQSDTALQGARLPVLFRHREPARFPSSEGLDLLWQPPFDQVADRTDFTRTYFIPDPLLAGTWLLSMRAPQAHLALLQLSDDEL